MTRKLLTAAVAIVAMMMSVFALSADANHLDKTCTTTYNIVRCNYPGPFTAHPAEPAPAYGFGAAGANAIGGTPISGHLPVAGTGADAGVGGTGGGLAHTGSESAVLGYVGAGMIAFGAVAMGSRRKFFQGALED